MKSAYFAFAAMSLISLWPDGTAIAGEWRYTETTDAMRNEVTRSASLLSENTLAFPFPYDVTNNRASLWLWKIGSTGQQMGISVGAGQFSCDESSHDSIAIKFDDGPIEYVPCEGGVGGRYDAIYVGGNVRPLVDRIRSAKKLIVEAEFYGSGRIQITFDTTGLDW